MSVSFKSWVIVRFTLFQIRHNFSFLRSLTLLLPYCNALLVLHPPLGMPSTCRRFGSLPCLLRCPPRRPSPSAPPGLCSSTLP